MYLDSSKRSRCQIKDYRFFNYFFDAIQKKNGFFSMRGNFLCSLFINALLFFTTMIQIIPFTKSTHVASCSLAGCSHAYVWHITKCHFGEDSVSMPMGRSIVRWLEPAKLLHFAAFSFLEWVWRWGGGAVLNISCHCPDDLFFFFFLTISSKLVWV